MKISGYLFVQRSFPKRRSTIFFNVDVSENSVFFPPKSSILIGFSIIFTIHFGGNSPIFGNTHVDSFAKDHENSDKDDKG